MTRPAAMLESALGLGHLVWLKQSIPAPIAAVLDETWHNIPSSSQLSCRACDSVDELVATIDHQTAMLLLPGSVLTHDVQLQLHRTLIQNVCRPELLVVIITDDETARQSKAKNNKAVADFKLLAGACSPILLPASALATSLPGLAGVAVLTFENHQRHLLQQQAKASTPETAVNATLGQLQRAQLFQSLLQILPVGIAVAHDVDCTHMTMNPAAAQLLDIPLDVNPSKTGPDQDQLGFTCLINGEVVPSKYLPIQHAARTGKTVLDKELQVIRGDGTKLDIVVSAVPLFDEHGKSIGSAGVLVDITSHKKIQQALAKTEARLNQAQKCAKAGIWEWNLITGEVIWSPGLCMLFGLPVDFDPSADAWHDIIHPDDLDAATAAIGNQVDFQIEHRINRKDGKLQWVLASGQPVLNEQGKAVRLLGICVDITEHKLAEQTLRKNAARFRTLMDASPLGVFITDATGKYEYANAVLQRISHVSDKQLIKQGLIHLVHADEKSQVQDAWNAALTKQQRFEHICRLQLPHEQHAWIHIRAAPVIDNGNFTGYIGKVEDITRQRRAQAALRQSQDHLQKANDSLEQRSEDMEELLSITAHDLKHAVVGIQGLLSLLKDDCYSKLDEENKVNLDLALGECERMKEMLTRLSELGRIEQTRPRMGVASLRDVVDTCVKRYQSLCQQHNITIKLDVPEKRIRMPKAILEEVLSNLIDNAIKYGCTSNPAVIEITATCEEQTCCLCVSDNGPGIDPQHHERIFRPFRRLVAKNGQSGSGLGLTAVKRLIQRIGGQVHLESTLGQGACFGMEFPIEDEKPCEDVP